MMQTNQRRAYSAYSAYGAGTTAGQMARVGYAGELTETELGSYHLGERLYDPVLRRFYNPDNASPFDEGDINRYAYCGGDPINRIDPSGNAWWNWLTAGAGPKTAIVRTTSADGGLTAATATPSIGSSTVAALADVVAISAGVGAGNASGAGETANVLGRLTQQARSTGSALLPKDSTGSGRFLGQHLRARNDRNAQRSPYHVTVFEADQRPPHKFRFSARTGTLKVKTHWHRRVHPDNPNISHWGADTAVSGNKMNFPLRKIGATPIVDGHDKVYLYSGVHGRPNGNNWRNGRRSGADALFYTNDVRDKERYTKLIPGRTLIIEDIAGISETDMINRSSRPGVHVHAYCYGAVDPVVLDVTGADPVPVYRGA